MNDDTIPMYMWLALKVRYDEARGQLAAVRGYHCRGLLGVCSCGVAECATLKFFEYMGVLWSER